MRLIQPSAGEAYDRLTILALKMKHSDRQEFKIEHEALWKYMKEMHYQVPTELADELGRINSKLWDLEDRQRILIQQVHQSISPKEEFCNNAINVVQLNDARAETVRKINVACGIDSLEKLHVAH